MGTPLKSYVIGQFKKPRGLVGALAGQIMRRRASNVKRNLWTVELIGLKPTDRVLEIGYGPGFALEHVCEQLTDGMAVGLDHSQTMLQMARRRNRKSIAGGKLTLLLGSMEDNSARRVPALSGPFNAIYAVNVAMFWREPIDVLRNLRMRLVDGGRVMLTLQPRSGLQTDAAAMAAGEPIAEQMRAAGLSQILIERLEAVTPMAVCVIGRKSVA